MSETLQQRFGDLQLAHPATWEVEILNDTNGLLLMDPRVEMDWQASILLELRRDEQDRPLDVAMTDLCAAQQEEHVGFDLRRQELREHPTGQSYWLLEFDSLTDGMPLTQRLILLATSGRGRLFVTAASERSLWPKYEPVFDAVMNSIRPAQA
jgi:hypothetical protein